MTELSADLESPDLAQSKSSAPASEFQGARGTYQLSRSGLGQRWVDAITDMRASTARLLREKPGEGRLLFYVLVSDMVFFISWTLKTLVAPASVAGSMLSPDAIPLLMIAALMLRTGAMYALSGLIWGASRIAGGTGTWAETRAATFWGAFVSAPFGLLAAVLAASIGLWEPNFPALANPYLQLPVYWLGLIPFVYYISAGIAQAQGFRMTAPTFMAMSAVAIGLTVVTLLYGIKDVIG
ncbi:MAG: YIP1 family protein [Pseudomonadota bacterium]